MMQDFLNKNILLGVCGGIAAYKAAYLVRELIKLGAEVRVVMTQSAQEFVTALTFQALSGHDVRSELFDTTAERAMGHIELARWADYLLVAPATAHCLSQFAHGSADDLLSTLYLVYRGPILVCPAMNYSMWTHPATEENIQVLRSRGITFAGPAEGSQACGDIGYGRMVEPESIIESLRLIDTKSDLEGYKILITAGPTLESIDPVRFISNRSSGKMGYALAFAAQAAGADVTLISGPTQLSCPPGVHLLKVESAHMMYDAVMAHLEPGMIFIACAAVADYAAQSILPQKIKKQAGATSSRSLDLTLNPDIVTEVVKTKKCAYVVGFAAETQDVLTYAREKRKSKHLDMIVANLVGDGLGFEQSENEVTVITDDAEMTLPKAHKTRLAGQIIKIVTKEVNDGTCGAS